MLDTAKRTRMLSACKSIMIGDRLLTCTTAVQVGDRLEGIIQLHLGRCVVQIKVSVEEEGNEFEITSYYRCRNVDNKQIFDWLEVYSEGVRRHLGFVAKLPLNADNELPSLKTICEHKGFSVRLFSGLYEVSKDSRPIFFGDEEGLWRWLICGGDIEALLPDKENALSKPLPSATHP